MLGLSYDYTQWSRKREGAQFPICPVTVLATALPGCVLVRYNVWEAKRPTEGRKLEKTGGSWIKTDRIWRALSVALALCLTLALAPTCAFAADADTESVEDGVSTSGVTDVTGGSGVTVKTEVRNNYTDTYERQTVILVNGTATVADDFSGLNGQTLTFAGLGDLTLQASYD